MLWWIARWWEQKKSRVFYSNGINYYEINKNHDTLHAEVDSIMNLPVNKKKKKIKVNMFVSRTNPKGNRLMMAKCCDSCLKYIHTNLPKKGYKLNKIYYTNEEGEIENI